MEAVTWRVRVVAVRWDVGLMSAAALDALAAAAVPAPDVLAAGGPPR